MKNKEIELIIKEDKQEERIKERTRYGIFRDGHYLMAAFSLSDLVRKISKILFKAFKEESILP